MQQENVYAGQGFQGNVSTKLGSPAPGFAQTFVNYPLTGGQLVATQEISHQFEALWTNIINRVPSGNHLWLSTIKEKLEEAYMFTGKAIATPVLSGNSSGAMSY